MWKSWQSGEFWVTYAARKNLAFDSIYWQKLDGRFFGAAGSVENEWEERLGLLDEADKRTMESLVEHKIEDTKERVLAWDPNE